MSIEVRYLGQELLHGSLCRRSCRLVLARSIPPHHAGVTISERLADLNVETLPLRTSDGHATGDPIWIAGFFLCAS